MHFIGLIPPNFQGMLRECSVASYCTFHGPVDYSAANKRISSADVALLIEADLDEGIFSPFEVRRLPPMWSADLRCRSARRDRQRFDWAIWGRSRRGLQIATGDSRRPQGDVSKLVQRAVGARLRCRPVKRLLHRGSSYGDRRKDPRRRNGWRPFDRPEDLTGRQHGLLQFPLRGFFGAVRFSAAHREDRS